jgi:hypothetical protein
MYEAVQPSNGWHRHKRSKGSTIPISKKMSKEMVCEIFKIVSNAAVNNALTVHNSRNKMHHLTYWLDLIKSLILTYKP